MPTSIAKIYAYGNTQDAYQLFQPQTYTYLHNQKRSWKTIANGSYQAGPYTIPVNRRGEIGMMPAMDLPGGPASPLSSSYKEYFARNQFDITLADWRGAGQARPLGGTEENATEKLVEDIEVLRKQSGYDKVMLRGGSWGATMALRYAEMFPDKVSGLVIGLPFLSREKDIAWNFAEDGIAQKYPSSFDLFMTQSGQETWQDAVGTYSERMNNSDPKIYVPAFIEWKKWEWAKCGEVFIQNIEDIDVNNERFQIDFARAKIMAHYSANSFFMPKEGVMPALSVIDASVPVIIVTNELDSLSCPDTLSAMKENMPNTEFIVNNGADWHWIFDPRTDAKGRNNDFIENGYAYATEKMRCMLGGKEFALNTEKPDVT